VIGPLISTTSASSSSKSSYGTRGRPVGGRRSPMKDEPAQSFCSKTMEARRKRTSLSEMYGGTKVSKLISKTERLWKEKEYGGGCGIE
jgi:hypothetical protein